MSSTVLFAGGGTGGHLFPAIATAEHLLREHPGCIARFLCSSRPLDTAILGAEQLHGVPVSFRPVGAQPFGVRPRALWKFATSWGGAVRAGRQEIQSAKVNGPVVVASFGGFVAAPIVQAARVEKCPILMVNLDAVPGRANRWMAKHVQHVISAAPTPGFNWARIPPIVRAAAINTLAPSQCRAALGLHRDIRTLLITGGSQGAGTINRFMLKWLASGASALAGWQVVHQSGNSEVEDLKQAYDRAGVTARVEPFFKGMGQCWGAADLAIGRSGAGSVAECWANRVPSLFLPYPFHADEHQRHNAAQLVEAGGAVVCSDRIDPDANVRDAGTVLSALLADAERLSGMRRALAALGPADGALQAARAIMKLLPAS